MKKIILWTRKGLLPMLLALILSAVTVPVRTASALPTPTAPWTMVYLDPPTIIGQTVGQVFTIDLNIFNATAIHGWQSGFIFNATLLTCTGFSQGEFLSDQASTSWAAGIIDNTAGVITAHGCSILGTDTASGNGRLAYLTFQVKAPGVSDLHFFDVTVVKFGIPPLVPINTVDVYTVVVDTTLHTVETLSDVSGKAMGYTSSFRDHAFSVPDQELSFTVENPLSAFVNVTIPKTLLWVDALDEWIVTIDGIPASRIATENDTHTSIYFVCTIGIRQIRIIGTHVSDSHDIGITSVTTSKTIIGQGYSLRINIRIMNYGINTENFNVTAYANTTIIDTLTNITLTSGNSTTITFTWNTAGVPHGNYPINATATPVLGETDLTDNTKADGWVKVTGVGDVNADYVVNVLDVILVLINVGPVPPKPPECDINGDNTIDVLDVILVLVNLGPV